MGKIILKTGKRRTSIPRALIRKAVAEVYAMDLPAPKKAAAKRTRVAKPGQRRKRC